MEEEDEKDDESEEMEEEEPEYEGIGRSNLIGLDEEMEAEVAAAGYQDIGR